MSNSTPPGWYPDPEPSPGTGAPRERYWDGGCWTAQYRPPGLPAHLGEVSDASPAYGHPAVPEPVEQLGYGYPQALPQGFPDSFPASFPPAFPAQAPGPFPPLSAPGYPPPPGPYGVPYAPSPPAPKRRAGLVVGLLSGALLLVAATVGGLLVSRHGSDAAAVPSRAVPVAPGGAAPSVPAPSDPPTGAPSGEQAPVAPDGTLQDLKHGWRVPLLPGWTNMRHDAGLTVVMVTGPYTCAMPGGCVRGNLAIGAGPVAGADARTVAEQAMEQTAPQLFGELTSHQQMVSGALTVAGVTGYAVRWHVTPVTGAQGYLLEVAVPMDGGFALITGSVDDAPDSPGPATLEAIVTNIRAGAGAAGAV